MDRRDFLGKAAAGSLGLGLLGSSPHGQAADRAAQSSRRRARQAKQPNIVLIMADDFGFSDVGGYGAEFDTPNIDRLADEGMRFSQFYNCARCCPTRASLLTGVYPHQAGVGHMIGEVLPPHYLGRLRDEVVTIPEALGRAGYHTGMFGKWHLSHLDIDGKTLLNFNSTKRWWDEKSSWPINRGFDEHYGTIPGVSNYYDPFGLVEGETLTHPESEDFYYTDEIHDRSVDYINRRAEKDEPFFLYVSEVAPHWPLHALEEDIEKYKSRYMVGWDQVRRNRYERQLEMDLFKEAWELTPRDEQVPAWDQAPHKDWEDHRMATYAAQVDRMDQGIGRILEALEENDIEDHTLVLFLGDNGGCEEVPKPHWYDIPSKTRGDREISVGNDPAVYPGPEDTWSSYGRGWANASNTPFRLFKHWVHEGGIATPFIARWPGKVEGQGAITHEVGHVMDLMATCLDVAGAEYPSIYHGHDILPMEGKSLMPILEGGTRAGHEVIGWEHEGHKALRQGNWKLVSRRRSNWELYDMDQDRSEMNNLASEHPRQLRQMKARYQEWAEASGVMPWQEYVQVRQQRAQQKGE